ncbi:MAG: hypothetical protein DA408_17055 [Bacteroidetes bacterium]|nr:MAG: hypothetical protein C7N36_17965 [Bacteroidota bacterium]PTM10001.1 MAG: hypothetical protein DA408_17055 [Bacteroidota bacterium]
MKMIKFFGFGFAFILAMNLQAQDTPPTPTTTPTKQERREMRAHKSRPGSQAGKQVSQASEHRQDMVQKLNLTEEQQAQFHAINQKYREQMQANRGANADREAMQTRKANKDAEMQGILTPAQFEIYQTETAPHKGPRDGNQGGRQGGNRGGQ